METRRVSVKDVIALTGLSRATVDRALNGRSGVRPRTRDIVREAYARLRSGADSNARFGPSKISTGCAPTDMVLRLGRGLTEQMIASCGLRGQPIQISDMYQEDNDAILEKVAHLCRDSERPLILAAKNNDRLCEELIAARRHGKRIVTLISDLDPGARDAFIGIDNRMAGQTAALLIGRLVGGRPSKVGLIVGDYAFRCHEDREIGFRAYLRTTFPDVVVADVARGEDSPQQTHQAIMGLFSSHPDIAAIYNLAGGNVGLASALTELGRAREVIVITHEANRITIPLLKSGTVDFVIAQDARDLFDAALRAANGLANSASQQSLIDFGIYSRFNIPAFSMIPADRS